ncbi:MAG: SctK family type III secretion system sorting platform protein [Thiotrichales bacterium]
MIEETRLQKIIEFNFSPENYCHPDWFHIFPEKKYVDSLCSQKTTSHLASRYILEYFNIAGNFHFIFEKEIHELALLDLPELNALIELIAIALYKNQIRKIINGELLRHLYSNLNSVSLAYLDSDHSFGNKNVSLPAIDEDEPLASMIAYGSNQLINSFKDEPDSFTSRVTIKLGPTILREPEEYDLNTDHEHSRRLVIHAFNFLKNKNT